MTNTAWSDLAPLCVPSDRDTILGRCREVARSLPHETAVIAVDGSMTFDELTHGGYAWARKIASLVPEPRQPIAIDADSTIESLTLIFAVFASGHPLVVLDAFVAEQRRRHILQQSGATFLTIDDLVRAEESSEPLRTPSGHDTALISFTSGSSGDAPKGVVLSHQMCINKAYEVVVGLGLHRGDRLGNLLPISSGGGITTMLAGLLSGIPVLCWNPRHGRMNGLPAWLRRCAATTLHCAPSMFRKIDGRFPDVRLVVTHGDHLHRNDVLAFRSRSNIVAMIVNWYATTEAGLVAFSRYAAAEILPECPGYLPVGRPLTGKHLDVVRADGSVTTVGEVGEIRVTTTHLADGYIGLPVATTHSFAQDNCGHRTYRTGDLGRLDERGILHLSGRTGGALDIGTPEIGAVHSALLRIEGVAEALVFVSCEDGSADVVAYIAPEPQQRLPSVTDIHAALTAILPEKLVPTQFYSMHARVSL